MSDKFDPNATPYTDKNFCPSSKINPIASIKDGYIFEIAKQERRARIAEERLRIALAELQNRMSEEMKEVLNINLGQLLKFSESDYSGTAILKKSKEILKNYEGKQYKDLALDMTGYLLAFIACYKKYEARLDATIDDIPTT